MSGLVLGRDCDLILCIKDALKVELSEVVSGLLSGVNKRSVRFGVYIFTLFVFAYTVVQILLLISLNWKFLKIPTLIVFQGTF